MSFTHINCVCGARYMRKRRKCPDCGRDVPPASLEELSAWKAWGIAKIIDRNTYRIGRIERTNRTQDREFEDLCGRVEFLEQDSHPPRTVVPLWAIFPIAFGCAAVYRCFETLFVATFFQ